MPRLPLGLHWLLVWCFWVMVALGVITFIGIIGLALAELVMWL